MKNCREIQKNISAYIDRETDTDLSEQIAGHLSRCFECKELFEEFQDVDTMLKQLPADSPSPDFARQVMKKSGAALPHEKAHSRFKSLIKFFEEFFELLESHTASHKSLDEFSDSPPFSMSHIYFHLLYPTK